MAARKRRGVPYQRGRKWVGGIDMAGRRYWVGSFDTKGQWEDAAARLRVQLRDELDVTGGLGRDLTILQFVNRGWPDTHPKARRTKQTSVEHLRERVQAVVRDFGDRRLYGGISRPEARAWALRQASGSVAAARQLFNDAIDDGLADANPFAGLQMTRSRGRRDIRVISHEEFERLVELARLVRSDPYGEISATLLLWQGTVGTRPGEAWGVMEEDLDPIRMRAFIRRRVDTKGRFDVPKSGLVREVMVPPRTMRAVLAMPRLHDQLLFPNPSGGVMLPPAWFWYWNPIRGAFLATLPAHHWMLERMSSDRERRRLFTLYELRHYAATWMSEMPPLGLGLDPVAVAAQLGHTDGGAMVMRLYRHMNNLDALGRVGEAFIRDDKAKDEAEDVALLETDLDDPDDPDGLGPVGARL